MDTPSERVLPKSASEGVERAQKKVWHHNGTDSRNLLPLRQRGMKAMPPTRPAERVLRKRAFHNGTESRNLLPLRQRDRKAMPPTRPVEWVLRERAFHNGTDSRNLLPSWKNEYVRGSGERVIFLNLPDKILHL